VTSRDESDFDARLAGVLVKHPAETEFAALCALYRAGNSAQRARLRDSVAKDVGSWALAQPDRYSLATRQVPQTVAAIRLQNLLTWSAAFPSDDFRDDLVALAPLYHSALRLGLDPATLFREAASMAATSEAAELIGDFPRRPPEAISLQAFLLTEVPTPQGGVRYVQTP
jgi:hypothetical protein